MAKMYRPNVALLLCNREGKVLVAERVKHPGAWQFPQGGVDKGETEVEALHREVEEELGLPPAAYEVRRQKGGYRYDFPESLPRWKNYCGQEQSYFLCDFTGGDSDIVLETEHQEFSAWRWIEPEEFDLDWVIDFKRNVYEQVLRDFFTAGSHKKS